MHEPNVRTVFLLSAIGLVVMAPLFLGESVQLGDLFLILRRMTFIFLVALGVGVVIACGEIDISSAGLISFTGIALIVLSQLQFGSVTAYLLVLLIVLAVGLLQGWLVAYKNVPSLILTLGVSFVFGGCALVGYNWLHEAEEAKRAVDLGAVVDLVHAEQEAIASGIAEVGTVLPESWRWRLLRKPWYLAASFFVVALWWRYRTLTALKHIASGLDSRAAVLAGVNVQQSRLLAFVFASGMTFLGSILWLTADGGGGWSASMGTGQELLAVAAAVLGGVEIRGGRFQPVNLLLAVALVVAVHQVAIRVAAIPPDADSLAIGVLVAGAAIADGLVGLRSGRKGRGRTVRMSEAERS